MSEEHVIIDLIVIEILIYLIYFIYKLVLENNVKQ